MAVDDRLVERRLLLRRAFPRARLFEICKGLEVPRLDRFTGPWDIDEDEAALEIASRVTDPQLREVFGGYKPRGWAVFRGRHYTLEDGALRLEGSWNRVQAGMYQAREKFGKDGVAVLTALVEAGDGCGLEEIRGRMRQGVDPLPILEELGRLGVIVASYRGDRYQEWKVLEETLPLVRSELGLAPPPRKGAPPAVKPARPAEVDYVQLEREEVKRMEGELDEYLGGLLRGRLDAALEFGRSFSVGRLAEYLRRLFGPVLYFDSLLSIVQQYGLSDTEIVHEQGRTGMRTGWSLALFGDPGTGKSFSTRDMILGRPDAKVPPHGVPGRNRYCGGMTPARFIRIGQAYVGRAFNFVVPEFNDWFRYSGMVEPLKLAMERGELKYEMHREVVGPYRFTSFLSVNYNVATRGEGYAATVQDPNFNAIEDRMLCRLHRLTKERFVEIAESQMRLAFGEIDIGESAQRIRDHLTLVYAIETGHPLVRDRFPPKPVMITPQAYEAVTRAREAILEQIPQETVDFSARLEDRAVRFACAASLIDYFRSEQDTVPVNPDALRYAAQLYVEEASVRSRGKFRPEDALKRLSPDANPPP